MINAIRFFLSTLALVVFLVLPGFFAWGQYKAYSLQNLITECSAQSVRVERDGREFFAKLKCSREEIGGIEYPAKRYEIQDKIHYASDGHDWFESWIAVSVFIVCLGAIPMLWQLFLRMISDISKAIRGQI